MHPSRSVYVGSDTLSAQVRMLLDSNFGQSLIDADSSVYASNAAWREHFKGLQVRSESGGGGIVSLEPNAGVSYLRLHYHNATDTTTYDFILNANAARIGHCHSWSSEFQASMTASPPKGLSALPSWVQVDLTSASTWPGLTAWTHRKVLSSTAQKWCCPSSTPLPSCPGQPFSPPSSKTTAADWNSRQKLGRQGSPTGAHMTPPAMPMCSTIRCPPSGGSTEKSPDVTSTSTRNCPPSPWNKWSSTPRNPPQKPRSS